MPPKAKTLTQSVFEKLGCKTEIKVEVETFDPTYTIKATYNDPKVNTCVEHRQIAEDDLINCIKNYMPHYQSIEVVCEQTGEVIYSRYANYEFFETGCEHIESPL